MSDYLVFGERMQVRMLLYRGRKGIFVIWSQDEWRDYRSRFLHLRQRIASNRESLSKIKKKCMVLIGAPDDKLESFILEKLEIGIGKRLGRIRRPITDPACDSDTALDREAAIEVDQHLHVLMLMRRLEVISQTVQICPENYPVFGPEVRNLLLLACTEAESLFKQMVFDSSLNSRVNMEKFHGANRHILLDQYDLEFLEYPFAGTLSPFRYWRKGRKYSLLPWYQAYNATKHNRYSESRAASIYCVLEAVAACFILIEAQSISSSFRLKKINALERYVHFRRRPAWRLGQHYYKVPQLPLTYVSPLEW